jgi:hypothetical protein
MQWMGGLKWRFSKQKLIKYENVKVVKNIEKYLFKIKI